MPSRKTKVAGVAAKATGRSNTVRKARTTSKVPASGSRVTRKPASRQKTIRATSGCDLVQGAAAVNATTPKEPTRPARDPPATCAPTNAGPVTGSGSGTPPCKSRIAIGGKLTEEQALIKYEFRLSGMDPEAFRPLDGAWVSTYDKAVTRRKTFGPSTYDVPWTGVLHKVAAAKGARIVGVLPHNHARDAATGLTEFKKRPDIVLPEESQLYERVKGRPCAGVRVLVGHQPGRRIRRKGATATMTTTTMATIEPSDCPLADMAFAESDHRRDDVWQAVCLSLAAMSMCPSLPQGAQPDP